MSEFIKLFLNKLKPIKLLHVAFDSGGKRKPTIILLHGIAATSNTWNPLIKELDLKKYRVVSIDLLGFGQSPKPFDCKYTIEDHIKYIRKTIKKLKITKPYKIVGHSMGSIIAARYGRMYFEEIDKLYLLSLPLYFKDDELHTKISRKHTDLFLKIYDFISQKKKFTISSSQNLRKFLRINDGIEVNDETWDSFRLSLKNTIIKQNTYDDINNIIVPIEIIYGALDQFMVQENISKLAIFSNINVTRLNFVDHSIGARFAKKVSEIIA